MCDNELVLIIPSKEMKKEILQYKEEHFKFGLQQVIVACDKDNVASAKTAMSCGGILVKEFTEDGVAKQHYLFELNCL